MSYIKTFFVIGFVGLGALTSAQSFRGYYKIKEIISKDSADSAKSRIRAISNDLFQGLSYKSKDGLSIPYRMLRPVKIVSSTRYPLVLVLHSSGTPIGTDNSSQMGLLAKLWANQAIRKKYPAYVVVPQFPRRSSNYVPDPARKVLVSSPDPCLSAALELIDSLRSILPVDGRKIYVIGFSMGASSTINALALRPGLFAAALSISGIPSFGNMDALASTPIWLVHGDADTENPIGSDSLFYKEIQGRGNRNIQFWQVEGLGHEIYPGLYSGEAIPSWLFTKSRKTL